MSLRLPFSFALHLNFTPEVLSSHEFLNEGKTRRGQRRG